jgi:sphingomyelin phosphodiesterase
VTSLQKRLDDWFGSNLTNYVLYPLEGNHDFVEPNSQDFTKQDPMIAYNLQLWDRYFDEEAKTVYAKHGYYSQRLRTKNPDGTMKDVDGVNVIAVNTEACYNMNFYLLSQRNDPGDVLAWLNETLHGFEQRGEIAVLMAHHPPGDADCLYQWSYRFRSILERYQHIVRWSVYGHVHLEIMGVAHSIKAKKPTGVHFWSGSVSSWFEVNPSFKVFEVDTKTMLPVKSHTYVLDITNTPIDKQGWKYSHEITARYNMTDLSPSSFVSLAERIRDNEDVALLYQRTQSNGGTQTYYDSCDEACRLNLYCSMINTVYFESKDCMGLPRFDIRNDPVATMMELLSDPWVVPK